MASELLTPDQLEIYRCTGRRWGNKPLIFGGGSADTSDSESLAGVEFVNGTRPGNQAVVDIRQKPGRQRGRSALLELGTALRPVWSGALVSCPGATARWGCPNRALQLLQSQGIPWFQSHGQWGGRDYANIAPGDAIFFDWDLDGSADHVGIVVGTTAAGSTPWKVIPGDACKIKSYSLTYECIKGYGLMNW